MGASGSSSRNTPVANGIRAKYSFPSSPEINSIDDQIRTIQENIREYKSKGINSSDLTAKWSELLIRKHALKAELRGAGYKKKSHSRLSVRAARKRARTTRRRKGRHAQ